MRGYFGIGMLDPKYDVNLGTLWRSAFAFGANFIFTVGARYSRQPSDTTESIRHIPYWRFTDLTDFVQHLPPEANLVAVERDETAMDLQKFAHPERAVYLLGPEDGSLGSEVIEKCAYVIRFDSRYCLNVSVAGSVVLYDRLAKAKR